jgi:integrase
VRRTGGGSASHRQQERPGSFGRHRDDIGVVHCAELIRAGRLPKNADITGRFLGLVTGDELAWPQFRQRFEAEDLSGLRERTREKAGYVFDVFEEAMRPKRLREVTEETVSKFAAALRRRPVKKCGKLTGQVGLSPWTIKDYLIAFKTALAWAVEQHLRPQLPALPAVKVPKKRPQPIADEEWQKLLAAAPDQRWRAYLLGGWYGGLRLSEARHLRRGKSEEWPWVDWKADRIMLPAKFAKSGEDQWMPLHSNLREALAALPVAGDELFPFKSHTTGQALSRNGITKRVISFARKAGVKLSMPRLRKGFGCRVAQQFGKGNAPVLHRLMRHSSMQVTMDFYANVDDALRDAMQLLDAEEKDKGKARKDAQEKAE